MELFRNIGRLLKSHWEKALVAVALLALIGAVVMLNNKKEEEQNKLEAYKQNITKRKVKGIPPVDVAALNQALAHATNAPALDFSLPHNLFNPVKWQKRMPDGNLIKIEKGTEVGPGAMRIVKVTPLSFAISFVRMAGSSSFQFSILQEAATTNIYFRQQTKRDVYVSTNQQDSTKTFWLREVKGTPDALQFTLELADGDRTDVATDKPFSRVEGYKVDLQYPPENNRNFPGRRVGDTLRLGDEDYIIVAITPNEVVFSARSNNKKTTIRNNAAQ